jgi:hypothetical protein
MPTRAICQSLGKYAAEQTASKVLYKDFSSMEGF